MLPEIREYFRTDRLPHMWCPGCGNGIVLHSLVKAIAELGLDKNKVTMVSGIGCSARATTYLDFDTLHTTHGRALAFATGIKLARPELHVFVLMGDGDCAAIGGNHLIHAARRNIDLTALVFNNSIYGMTGGQASPMTPHGKKATTAPLGTLERAFDLCELARAAGATMVGRATAYHTRLLTELLVKGHRNKGFSLIEVITQCPTSYGRRNKMGQPADMLRWQKEHAVNIKAVRNMDSGQLQDKIIIGELYRSTAPELTTQYQQLIQGLRERE